MTRYDKFNFVFFLNLACDYYRFMFYDALALSNVRFIEFIGANLNGKVSLAFKPFRPANNPAAFVNLQAFDIRSPKVFAQDFPTDAPIVFFFWANEYNFFRKNNFFKYLRKNYPDCKLVCWLTNPLQFYKRLGMFLDKAGTNEILSAFDCVFTYNQVDAIDYGMTYFEGPYSVLPFAQPNQDVDIFFVGLPKDRLEKILRAYETFKAAGFVCDFHISNLSNPPSIKADDLHFNGYLPYIEILKCILCSRAVLDICTAGTYGLTPRYFESLAYDKIFITDNAFYRQERFTSPKLFLIDRSLELDRKIFMAASKLTNNYRNEYSPLRLITFLESVLNA
ncbi:MAG: hypothetical protein IJR52_05285 [Selenomonadaceae bacterium]|nr:hypothetical protein [Selenomonadaceae bacterium]MBQ9496975.1 hypothetical protein [Selenomonadaceae bacterium]